MESLIGQIKEKTLLLFAEHLISQIEKIHLQGVIHRDIKPANLLVTNTQIMVIDLGVAKRYVDPSTGRHIPLAHSKVFFGSTWYASLNAHCGTELSRRDDLESLGYTLIHVHQGWLPWQELAKQTIRRKKMIAIEDLCSKCPMAFSEYMRNVRALKFDQDPDYDLLRHIFRSATRAREGGIGTTAT